MAVVSRQRLAQCAHAVAGTSPCSFPISRTKLLDSQAFSVGEVATPQAMDLLADKWAMTIRLPILSKSEVRAMLPEFRTDVLTAPAESTIPVDPLLAADDSAAKPRDMPVGGSLGS